MIIFYIITKNNIGDIDTFCQYPFSRVLRVCAYICGVYMRVSAILFI